MSKKILWLFGALIPCANASIDDDIQRIRKTLQGVNQNLIKQKEILPKITDGIRAQKDRIKSLTQFIASQNEKIDSQSRKIEDQAQKITTQTNNIAEQNRKIESLEYQFSRMLGETELFRVTINLFYMKFKQILDKESLEMEDLREFRKAFSQDDYQSFSRSITKYKSIIDSFKDQDLTEKLNAYLNALKEIKADFSACPSSSPPEVNEEEESCRDELDGLRKEFNKIKLDLDKCKKKSEQDDI